MIETIKKLLEYELRLVSEKRRKGIKCVRPSFMLLTLLCLFYVLSGVDLIPEVLIHPKVFGFIDDIIIVCVYIVITSSEMGELLHGVKRSVGSEKSVIQTDRVSETKVVSREDSVLSDVRRDSNDNNNDGVTSVSYSFDNSMEYSDRAGSDVIADTDNADESSDKNYNFDRAADIGNIFDFNSLKK